MRPRIRLMSSWLFLSAYWQHPELIFLVGCVQFKFVPDADTTANTRCDCAVSSSFYEPRLCLYIYIPTIGDRRHLVSSALSWPQRTFPKSTPPVALPVNFGDRYNTSTYTCTYTPRELLPRDQQPLSAVWNEPWQSMHTVTRIHSLTALACTYTECLWARTTPHHNTPHHTTLQHHTIGSGSPRALSATCSATWFVGMVVLSNLGWEWP